MTLCIVWRRNRSPRITSVLPTLAFALLLWSPAFFPGVARAQGGFIGDVQGCPADQPCFNEAHQVGDSVVFRFTAIDSWDFYNVRYVDGGGNVKQVENKSGHYTFTNVEPGRVYRISVQGCTSHTLAHSTCSPWSEASVTTAGGTGSVSQPVVGPRVPSEPVKSLGRVGVPSGRTGPPVSICERARDARARNSPVAPDLEAQCRAYTAPAASAPVPQQSGGAPIPVCDAARAAREQNSPEAANLEAQCRANGGGLDPSATPGQEIREFAEAGRIIAADDPLAGELRRRQPDPNRRGFDIGLGATGSQTEWGPGKQRVLDSLTAPNQEGFKIAASFALDRNRNLELAKVGAAIAETDELVARARAIDPDVRYWLGFDIATGIFGDPKVGAKGNTATGTGSMQIRDGLSAPAQRGFNASVAFHLRRHY
jgi:hypothetical protein